MVSHHGKGAIKEIPSIAKTKGFKHIFVCSDPDLIKFGVTAKVTNLLDEAGIAYTVYSGIKPNPTIENVKDGVEAFKACGADSIITIGGGSSMDTAKAIGVENRAYVYGCDEVNKEYFPAIRAAVNELKQALPGVPISTTAYDHEFGVDTPLDVMDWFTPLTPKFDPEKAAKSRAAGHQVWWYICCGPHAPHANMFIECPAIEGRLLMGAQTVRQRPDGFLYYQISIWNSKRCITSGPFTDWDPRSWTKYYGDGSWTCVGPDGTPLPTIRLENFRDGLEDYAYALLLEKKLKSHADQNDAWAKRARELLAVPHDVMDTMRNYTGDPAAVYRWRDAMADLMEQ